MHLAHSFAIRAAGLWDVPGGYLVADVALSGAWAGPFSGPAGDLSVPSYVAGSGSPSQAGPNSFV